MGWLAALAMPGLLLAQSGQAPAVPTAQATAFDTILQRVIGPASLDASSTDYDADLQRLRAALPAGDRARDARFRSVYCGSSTWRDPVQGLAYADGALALARLMLLSLARKEGNR